MSSAFDILAAVFLVSGFFFLFVGTLGLIRLPDTYTRLHATGKCDTLGAMLTLGGCMFVARDPSAIAKLLAIAGFLWIINPGVAHIIARIARATDVPMTPGTEHRSVYRPCQIHERGRAR